MNRHAVCLSSVVLALSACGSEPVAPVTVPVDPVVVETANFLILDQAGTSPALLDSLAVRLEFERERVAAFFAEFVPPETIVFNLRAGDGLPFVDPGDNSMNQWLESLSLDYIPHQLTHLWTRYTRRAFLEEGIAVYVTEILLPAGRSVNPYRGQPPHAWVSLFADRGTTISLFSAYRAGSFSFSLHGSSGDAFAWQVFVEAGSFTRWVMERFGRDVWLQLFQSQNLSVSLGSSTDDLEREWLAAARLEEPTPRPCSEGVGTLGPREEFWCARVDPE